MAGAAGVVVMMMMMMMMMTTVGAPHPLARERLERMTTVLAVAVIDPSVEVLAVAAVDGSVEAQAAGLILPAVTKHKEQATVDDDIPPSGRRRIEWQQLLPRLFLPILEGKVARHPAPDPVAQQRVPILDP